MLLLDFCFIVVTFSHTSFITRARNLFLKEKAGLVLLDPWKQGIDIYKRNILRLMLKLRICPVLLVQSVSLKCLPLDDIFEF